MRLKLREQLARQGISQNDLAKKTGFYRSYITAIAGETTSTITMRTLDRLCRALDVGPADLLELESGATEPGVDG